jgi:hypothetical protein
MGYQPANGQPAAAVRPQVQQQHSVQTSASTGEDDFTEFWDVLAQGPAQRDNNQPLQQLHSEWVSYVKNPTGTVQWLLTAVFFKFVQNWQPYSLGLLPSKSDMFDFIIIITALLLYYCITVLLQDLRHVHVFFH